MAAATGPMDHAVSSEPMNRYLSIKRFASQTCDVALQTRVFRVLEHSEERKVMGRFPS